MTNNKIKNKVKGRWSRAHAPRSKFITASVTPREWQDCHVIAAAMHMTVSGCLRQLVADQYAVLLAGGNYVSPVPEQKLDLKSEEV